MLFDVFLSLLFRIQHNILINEVTCLLDTFDHPKLTPKKGEGEG